MVFILKAKAAAVPLSNLQAVHTFLQQCRRLLLEGDPVQARHPPPTQRSQPSEPSVRQRALAASGPNGALALCHRLRQVCQRGGRHRRARRRPPAAAARGAGPAPPTPRVPRALAQPRLLPTWAGGRWREREGTSVEKRPASPRLPSPSAGPPALAGALHARAHRVAAGCAAPWTCPGTFSEASRVGAHRSAAGRAACAALPGRGAATRRVRLARGTPEIRPRFARDSPEILPPPLPPAPVGRATRSTRARRRPPRRWPRRRRALLRATCCSTTTTPGWPAAASTASATR